MSRTPVHSVQLESHADHVRLRLRRPERYNVLDINLLAELAVSLDDARGESLPLVLDGEGRVFSLGADVRELAGFSSQAASTYSRLGQQTVAALESWPSVTIARLSGYAMGAGLELALGCDILVADPDVRIGLPGLAWALVPCFGGLRRLYHRVGSGVSSDLFLRGMVLDGPAALEAKLVDRVLASNDELDALIREVAEFSPAAVAAIRDLRLRRYGTVDMGAEAELFAQPFVSGECQRRLQALL